MLIIKRPRSRGVSVSVSMEAPSSQPVWGGLPSRTNEIFQAVSEVASSLVTYVA